MYTHKKRSVFFDSVPTLFFVKQPDKGNSVPFLSPVSDRGPLFIANRFPNGKCLCIRLRGDDPLNAIIKSKIVKFTL